MSKCKGGTHWGKTKRTLPEWLPDESAFLSLPRRCRFEGWRRKPPSQRERPAECAFRNHLDTLNEWCHHPAVVLFS